MALIDTGLSHPDQLQKGSAHDPRRVSVYNRWVEWPEWRDNTGADVYPHTLTHPDHYPPDGASWDGRIVDIRGCDHLIIAVTGEALDASGLITNVTAWEGELWVLAGPPSLAQWCLVPGSETGAMSGKTYYKIAEVPGAWFAMFRIASRTGAGVMKIGLRQL
jgi:hypothetical protein